jgi:HAD superfamily hydrolase (TIGR01459 family)
LTAATIDSLAALPDRYRLILCDLWGCVHDGVMVYPEARALLMRWRRDGRIVLLLTNAPRPASAVRDQLRGFGLRPEGYDAVITSGETGLEAVRAEGIGTAGFIGRDTDRDITLNLGLTLVDPGESDVVICTGFDEARPRDEDYRPILSAMHERGARMLCFNPDRFVLRGGIAESCAGAIADLYEAIGGEVEWFGKPYARIYQRCMAEGARIAGRPLQSSEVVAIGDSLATDYLGAARAGFDFIFVTGGIESDRVAEIGAERLLADFARVQGLPLRPAPRLVERLADDLVLDEEDVRS